MITKCMTRVVMVTMNIAWQMPNVERCLLTNAAMAKALCGMKFGTNDQID